MSSMDDWRGARADSRGTVDEQRTAAADGDEDRAIRRFLAATEQVCARDRDCHAQPAAVLVDGARTRARFSGGAPTAPRTG